MQVDRASLMIALFLMMQGDGVALSTLYDRCTPLVFDIALRITGDRVGEVAAVTPKLHADAQRIARGGEYGLPGDVANSAWMLQYRKSIRNGPYLYVA